MKNLIILPLLYTVVFAQVKSVDLPEMEPISLQPYAQLDANAHPETSGIIKSRLYEGVYWLHSDSGDEPRIIPTNREGEVIQSYRYGTQNGQFISDAVNMDWEEIMTDDQGNIIVADFGNNCNCRRDLVFYYIRESDPTQRNNRVFKKVFFQYPDQKNFPAGDDERNFDAEGAFFAYGKIYVLSKNRSNTHTKLYHLDSYAPFEVHTLNKLDEFDIKGRVTAADVTEDGKRIAVLTWNGVWIFEAPNKDDYFDGKIWWLPLESRGMEGICFDGDKLIFSKERGPQLFELSIEELKRLR